MVIDRAIAVAVIFAIAASDVQRLILGALVIGPRTKDSVGLKIVDYAICGQYGQCLEALSKK